MQKLFYSFPLSRVSLANLKPITSNCIGHVIGLVLNYDTAIHALTLGHTLIHILVCYSKIML